MKHSKTVLSGTAMALIALYAGVAATAAPVHLVSLVSVSPVQAKVGKAEAISLALTAHDSQVSGAIVDLEVFDTHGKKVGQHFWQKQAFAKGHKAAYKWGWIPPKSGTYTIKVGVFGASWKPLYFWDNAALALKVS